MVGVGEVARPGWRGVGEVARPGGRRVCEVARQEGRGVGEVAEVPTYTGNVDVSQAMQSGGLD